MAYQEAVTFAATKLRDSYDTNEFQAALDEITRLLNNSGFTGPEKDVFWEEVRKEYEKLPKLLLKEATAAAKLMTLMNAANALINAQKKK